jgi:deoxyribodipyrimidine photo-lyase
MLSASPAKVIYLFHRDLRIVDNRGLNAAIQWARDHSTSIIPLFVFTPTQVSRSNPYKSHAAIHFMLDSLRDLESAIAADGGHLVVAYGDTVTILKRLHEKESIGAVFDVRDYTPFAKQREAAIKAWAGGTGIVYNAVDDIYLTTPGSVLTGTGRTFQKFTPFYETARHRTVDHPTPKPRSIPWSRWKPATGTTLDAMAAKLYKDLPEVAPGGRTEGLKRLATAARLDYEATHDRLDAPTSALSAHNHFGTVSIREVFWGVPNTAFRRQLYWRDFYGHIMAAFEDLYGVGPWEFQKPLRWRRGEREVFEAWAKGQTGVPLVDAAMHQLLRTGFMHNRARMLVASWLVKDKGVQWRWGERFFAAHLVDYDAAQNMMNWVWIASALPFASAPFRRHDPDRYAERFDPEGVYQARWEEK